jgi:hypothetical protein
MQNFMLVHGGIDSQDNFLNDMFLYHLYQDRWEKIFHRNNAVPALANHSVDIYVDVMTKETRAYIFGGENQDGVSDELYVANLSGERDFRVAQQQNRILARSHHLSIIIGKHLIVVGGLDSNGVVLTDMWAYDLGEVFGPSVCIERLI